MNTSVETTKQKESAAVASTATPVCVGSFIMSAMIDNDRNDAVAGIVGNATNDAESVVSDAYGFVFDTVVCARIDYRATELDFFLGQGNRKARAGGGKIKIERYDGHVVSPIAMSRILFPILL